MSTEAPFDPIGGLIKLWDDICRAVGLGNPDKPSGGCGCGMK